MALFLENSANNLFVNMRACDAKRPMNVYGAAKSFTGCKCTQACSSNKEVSMESEEVSREDNLCCNECCALVPCGGVPNLEQVKLCYNNLSKVHSEYGCPKWL